MPDEPPARGPSDAPPNWGLSASAYAILGVAGVALFLVAVVTPILAWLPETSIARIALAAAGGFLAVVGLGRWSVLRRYSRGGRRPTEAALKKSMPSIEFFSPPRQDDERPRRRTAARAAGPRTIPVIVGVALALAMLGSMLPAGLGAGSGTVDAPARLHASAGPPIPVCNPPFYPVYTAVDGLFPPLPKYIDQTPCPVSHDEVHATFSSNVPSSGEQVDFPIHLPGNGSVNPDTQYSDAYLGMVVAGDASSVDGQSYAEFVMAPGWNGTGLEWNLTVGIWSLILNTTCATGLNLTFLNEYACLVDEAFPGGHATLGTGVPGDQWANVTFTGSATNSTGILRIDFNDSSDSSFNATFVANAATTGTDAFQPYYDSACADLCSLNWSQPFGLGLGVDLCDYPNCYSYNASAAASALPFEVFSPEFWNGLSFAGDYQYVAYESSTGACSGLPGVAGCSPYAQIGEYPFFTFNGSSVDFGGNYSWTTETFGGAAREFNPYATSTDNVPLFLSDLTNSSRAGYVAWNASFTATLRIQDLGSLRWANLSYELPGGAEGNVTMALVSGSASDGFYNATVPAVGSNGTVQFRAIVTNRAGMTETLPPEGFPASSVTRSAIPTVTAVLDQYPPGCGGLAINGGGVQPNGTPVALEAGDYALRTQGCWPNVFSGWQTTGGLSIVGVAGPSTTIELHANGTVTALWRFVEPHDGIAIAFSPSTCGSVSVNATTVLAPGRTIALLQGGTYPIGPTPCVGETFAGWSVSSATNLTLFGANLTVEGNGTITAHFVPVTGTYPLLFETDPGNCGGVRFGSVGTGAGYVNGSSVAVLPSTVYPVGPIPCSGWGFAGNVTTGGGAVYGGGAVRLTAPGSIEYAYYKLTLVNVVTSPTGCGGVEFDGIDEPGGSVLNITNHTVHTVLAEPCPGYYVQAFTALGNLTLSGTVLTVNGPGTLQATFRAGEEQYWVGFISNPISCGAIVFDGTSYTNSEYDYVLPQSAVSLTVDACAGYGFVAWQVSGGVALRNAPSDPDNLAYVNGSGSVEAIFHPLVAVAVETDPATCGSVEIAGVAYANGESPLLPDGDTFPVAALPCVHDELSAWQTSSGASISGGNLTISATAIVLALFLPELYPIHVTVAPASCGPLVLEGLDELNNTTVPLAAGAYSLAPSPCTGFELLGFATDAGLSVSGSTLDVNGAGNLTERMGPVPPALTLALPASTAIGSASYLSVAVAVPVPPYNYTYVWSFGDGTTATTPSNFTSHAYASAGTYEVSVTVTDPYGQSATAVGNVTVVASPAAAAPGIGTLGIAILIGAVAAIGVTVGVLALRARRPPEAERP